MNFCCPGHLFKRIFVSLLTFMSYNCQEEWLVNIPLYAMSEAGGILVGYTGS
jgi:hypothetical protein